MTSSATSPVTPERIQQLAWGYVPPLVLEAAVRHRIFDVLDEGPKTISEIQTATRISARGLAAVINVLVGLNFLSKDAQSRYSLTPESASFLVRGKPGYLGGMLSHTSNHLLPKWLGLSEIVKTGKPERAVNQQASGAAFFEQFVADLFPMNYPAAKALAEGLHLKDAPSAVRVLDLAAGSGVWGIALAQSSEHVRVTAVDWAEVLPVTRKMTEQFHLADRFAFVAGDLLAADFGTGHNIATLGHILHSEGEERSRKLLAKVHQALAPGATIAIAEFLVDEDRRGPVGGLFFAVNMLVNTDEGDTYSFPEISRWLQDAGFRDARTLAVPGPSPLILASKR